MASQILIIDDDNAFRFLLEKRLRSFLPDLSITSFDRIEKARTHLRQQSAALYDLIILDQHLPDGRGEDLLREDWLEGLAVLSVSSDTAPELPGSVIKAGATYFLAKTAVSEPLFKPLVLGLIDRNKLQRALVLEKIKSARVDTVKTLVGTLRHEINNPLGAVLGAAYLLGNTPGATDDQKEAASLVEQSGKRIKHVLDKLCEAIELDPVQKASHTVFHIPGDAPWEDAGNKKKS